MKKIIPNLGKILKKTLLCLYIFFYLASFLSYKERIRYYYPNFMFESNNLSRCVLPSDLGPVKLNMLRSIEMEKIQEENKKLRQGGIWKPENCKAWQKVAIIIPYRDRWQHLTRLLHRLHPMLQRQMIDYQVFLIEQTGIEKLNKGKILNIGVLEAIKEERVGTKPQQKSLNKLEDETRFDCFLFHDVDLLPEDDRNLYHCSPYVHHLISALDEMRYHLLYHNNMGGVLSINRKNIFEVNGHSNVYWGWGNEDDDFNARTEAAGLLMTRPLRHIGRFKMVRHPKLWRESNSNDLFLTWRSRWKNDGLAQTFEIKNETTKKTKDTQTNKNINEISMKNQSEEYINNNGYKVISRIYEKLYTHIIVDVGSMPYKDGKNYVRDNVKRESLWWMLTYFFP